MRRRVGLLFIFMLFQGLLELGFVSSLSLMSVAITSPDTVRGLPPFMLLTQAHPAFGVWCGDPRHLVVFIGFFVVFTAMLKNIVSASVSYRTARLGEDMSISIGDEIMRRFLHQNYAWHLSSESSETFQRMTWRGQLSHLLINMLSMYTSILTMLILFTCLVGREPLLSTFVVTSTVAIGLLLYHMVRNRLDQSALRVMRSSQDETKSLLCATKGIREVLIYRQQPVFLNAITEAAERGKYSRIFTIMAASIPTWALEVVGIIMMVLALVFLVFVQHADIPRITAAIALLTLTAWRVLPYCNRIISCQMHIRSTRPQALAVLDLLEQLRRQSSGSIPNPDPDFRFKKGIELRGVSFVYPSRQEESLKNINFFIPKGASVGIIGPSGAGKSTLVNVLCGLLPPSRGVILIDGVPLDGARAAAFAARIGYVPQSPFLFAGTLAENVAFSQWGRPPDKDRVAAACAKAAIDFLAGQPEGIHMSISENGSGLSGGQAQRVSIARALYSDPSIIIFDEATSALDHGNEDHILETLRLLPSSTTSLFIAHRLTTVEHCDILIWLDQGRLIESGPPRDVLPRYRQSLAPPHLSSRKTGP